MEDEKLLKQKYGDKNPFTIPSGYFDGFEERIMTSIQQQTHKNGVRRILRSVMMWASCAAVAIIVCVAYFNIPDKNVRSESIISANGYRSDSDDYITVDEFTDYAMLDNQDIYSYISGE